MKQEEIANRFMHGLDKEEYEDVAQCISPDCQYEIAGKTHHGPEAIVASYQGNGDWAAENIEKIGYGSALVEVNERAAKIEFLDYLEHGGQKLTHRCHQHLEFDNDGLICSIRHEDLPGEREALSAFFIAVGLKQK